MLGDDGYPYGLPLDHWYCESDGKIYFHCGRTGYKLDAIRAHDKVSYCVCDQGVRKADEWALNFRSVIVFGRIRIVDDPARIEAVSRQLSYKFTSDESYIAREIANHAAHTLLLELTPEYMTGKRVQES